MLVAQRRPGPVFKQSKPTTETAERNHLRYHGYRRDSPPRLTFRRANVKICTRNFKISQIRQDDRQVSARISRVVLTVDVQSAPPRLPGPLPHFFGAHFFSSSRLFRRVLRRNATFQCPSHVRSATQISSGRFFPKNLAPVSQRSARRRLTAICTPSSKRNDPLFRNLKTSRVTRLYLWPISALTSSFCRSEWTSL